MKKILALLLCLAVVSGFVFSAVPAGAASAKKTTGYNQKTPPKNADDFSWDNASVYFLLTDRFKNGNTSNDHSYGRATDSSGQPLSGWQSNPGTFHGGDFAGITQKINEGYFDNLGVNAIWLSAPYEQIHGYVTPGEQQDFSHYSYHGYYVLDYTETDANFGTKQEFQTMVDTAHKHGIRVVMDIVMNHAGYNTIKDMIDYNFGKFKDKSTAQSYIYKLTGVNGLHDYIDYESGSSEWGNWWGSDWVRSGLPGYSEESGSDLTNCLAGLPDFRTESTKSVSIPPILRNKWNKEGTYNQKVSKYGSSDTVSGYITKWLSEWVSTYGVDGFRCDTAKHVDLGSWKKLKTSCVSALKQWRQKNSTKDGAKWTDDFWMTGECWDWKGLDGGDYYTAGGFDSMINFGFSGSGVPGISSINGTYQGYAKALNTKEGHNVLTYISSHDSNLARGDLIYQGSAFQMLPGAIQIFYGDETNRPTVSGMSFDGHGRSGHSLRSDMNWDSMDKSVLNHWQKVGKFRSKHICIGAGDHQQITAYNAETGYTFSRTYDRGELADGIIAVIGAPKNKKISVNVSSMWGNKTKVTNFYDGSTATVVDGKVEFDSGENGTILIEGPQSSIRMKLTGDYAFYDSETVSVMLKGADYAMVKIDGGKEFKVVNGSTFKIGEGIELGKVFTVEISATSGSETLEKSFNFKKKDPNAITRLYFDNSSYNWSNVSAYIYDESGSDVKANSAWPGKPMSLDSSLGLYVIEVDDGLENGKVIFTGGNNRYPQGEGAPGLDISETNMIFLGGNKWEPYNGQTPTKPAPPDPSKMTTIYFDNSNSNFATPYVYYWNKDTDQGETAWPGTAMTKYKDNVWKASFAKEYNMCIFSNNGGNQTGNLDIPGTDQIFNGTSWSKYADAEVATAAPTNAPATQAQPVTKTPVASDGEILIGDTNSDSVINVRDVTRVQKHIACLLYMEDNEMEAADVDKNASVSIKDATMIQQYIAKNYSLSGSCGQIIKKTAQISTQAPVVTQPLQPDTPTDPPADSPTSPPVDPQTATKIYFDNSSYNWSNVSAYIYDESGGEVKANSSWPGKPMTLDSSLGLYVIDVEEGLEKGKVIFTGANNRYPQGEGTPGLDIAETSMIFLSGNKWEPYSGQSTVKPIDDDPSSMTTIYFDNSNSNFATPYVYYWNKASDKGETAWPGKAMTKYKDNIWKASFSKEYDMCIFSNNGGNQTGNLDIPGTNKVFNGSGWTDYSE